jgi:hypothetical protein
MITGKDFTRMALSMPGTEQKPHFDRIGFKVVNKRMYASYLNVDNTANIFLTPKEQAIFCKEDVQNIYPVPNKWGEKGATTFVLDKLEPEVVMEELLSAYKEVMKPSKK